jgi:hypothetical protein
LKTGIEAVWIARVMGSFNGECQREGSLRCMAKPQNAPAFSLTAGSRHTPGLS